MMVLSGKVVLYSGAPLLLDARNENEFIVPSGSILDQNHPQLFTGQLPVRSSILQSTELPGTEVKFIHVEIENDSKASMPKGFILQPTEASLIEIPRDAAPFAFLPV